MKSLQLVFIALIVLSGCAKKADVRPAVPNDIVITKENTHDTLSYPALGDSYTLGKVVTTLESYPYQLADSLNAQSFIVQQPTVVAKPGWTTDDLIAAVPGSGISSAKFDFVTLLIGVNDEAQGLSQSNYKAKFTTLLNMAVSFTGGDASRVFVLSIPDWGATPFANGQDSIIGPQIDSFNIICKAQCLSAGVVYLDITGISRQAATDPSLIAPDGLHPSGKMYKLWINLLEPLVAKKLRK
jgi:lysophospholipase L1-like esterase